METTYQDLIKKAEKRNKYALLYRLFLSPRYEAPWWYWLDFIRANSN